MSANRKIGLELRAGHDVGRDPRCMTGDELTALGHQHVSPLRALRLRCVDCCGGSAPEVRLCAAVECPAWPFRMGSNPWRAPASEAQMEVARRLPRKQARHGAERPALGIPRDAEQGAATPVAGNISGVETGVFAGGGEEVVQ